MSRPRWETYGENPSFRWECWDDECDGWGMYGGESAYMNRRRTKAAAREHSQETGHSVSILAHVGWWRGSSYEGPA